MSSTETPTRPAAEHWSVPELARRPILLVAAVVGVALLATSWPYGYFGDELYFIAAGTHHRSEEHTSELQSRFDLVCRLLLEKKKKKRTTNHIIKLNTNYKIKMCYHYFTIK